MEAHAAGISIGTTGPKAKRSIGTRLRQMASDARSRRRERAIRAHGVRAGSPPGGADRLYFRPY